MHPRLDGDDRGGPSTLFDDIGAVGCLSLRWSGDEKAGAGAPDRLGESALFDDIHAAAALLARRASAGCEEPLDEASDAEAVDPPGPPAVALPATARPKAMSRRRSFGLRVGMPVRPGVRPGLRASWPKPGLDEEAVTLHPVMRTGACRARAPPLDDVPLAERRHRPRGGLQSRPGAERGNDPARGTRMCRDGGPYMKARRNFGGAQAQVPDDGRS
jgi:hypothetical protein